MNAAPVAPVVRAPSTSTNPFNNKINLSTKEEISGRKTETDRDILLDRIALTVENGGKFLAQMKSKCSNFRLNKHIWILNAGNGIPPNLQVGLWNNFGEYSKLLYNCHKLSEDQVTALTCYNWDGNNMHCVKWDPLVLVPLNFTVVDPELQSVKEKQQDCICAEMIFKIILINVPTKYCELYMVESYRFLFMDNFSGNKIGDCVILLKIILDNIKPIIVLTFRIWRRN